LYLTGTGSAKINSKEIKNEVSKTLSVANRARSNAGTGHATPDACHASSIDRIHDADRSKERRHHHQKEEEKEEG
jgi:hypothetical protein